MVVINKELLPMKSHYMFFYAGVAPVVLFVPTYAKQIGFSSVLVGIIYTILPLVGMLSKPIMGALADKFNCHRNLVILLLVVTSSSWFCLQFIPTADGDITGSLTCSDVDALHTEVTICSPEKVTDKCSIYKLQKEHSQLNNLIDCKISCRNATEFCNEWKNFTDYCKPNSNLTEFLMYAELSTQNVKTVLHSGKTCLSLPIEELSDRNHTEDSIKNPTCTNKHTSLCTLHCESILLAKFHGNVQEEKIGNNYRFWMFIILMILGWVGLASITNLGDTICFGLIGDSTVLYGNQRMWGSVGWGVVSILSGLLMDTLSDGKADKNYTPLFYMVIIFLGLDILSVRSIRDTKRVQSMNFFCDIGKLFLDFRTVVFIVWCMLAGTFNGMIGNFLFWQLETLAECKDEANIKTLEGLYILIQGFCGEIPFFFINGFLLKKIGHINCMTLVLFAFALKFFFYSIIENPWYALPIGILNGVTFSTFYATMASHAAAIATPGTEATVQGLVSALYEGVGVSVGSFLAGVLLYYFDGRKVFELYGLVALTMCIVHAALQYVFFRSDKLDISIKNEKGASTEKPSA